MPVLIANIPLASATAAGLRRRSRTKTGGDRFSLKDAGEVAPEAPAGVAFVSPTALLQIQEAPGEAPTQAVLRRANDLLDRLNELRLALLAGAIPASRLQALREALAARREAGCDPALAAVMDEIELRAAVELAKLGHAGGY